MAGKKINDQPLVLAVTGDEKIPTGEVGDLTVSVNQIANFTVDTLKNQSIGELRESSTLIGIDENYTVTGVKGYVVDSLGQEPAGAVTIDSRILTLYGEYFTISDVAELTKQATEVDQIVITTTDTSAAATVVGSIALTSQVDFYRIETTSPCRVRLYFSEAGRDADLTRSTSQDAAQGSDLVFEFVSVAELLSANLTPIVAFYSPQSGTVYYSITNTGTSQQSLSATLKYYTRGG